MLFLQIPFDQVLSFGWVFLLVLMFFYGQKIQLYLTLRSLSGGVSKLKRMRDEGRTRLLETLKKFNAEGVTMDLKVDKLLELFVISPVNLDPKGIVSKIEHLVDTYDDTLLAEVKKMAPNADKSRARTLSNLLEVAIGLNVSYRIARHFYLSGKQGNMFAVIQLQITFPMILEAAEAYHASLEAFSQGLTIGDGLGPLVAAKLIDQATTGTIAKDTIVSEATVRGRKVYVVKAEGPGGNVGKPGEAIKKLLDVHRDMSLIITVDAALRLEGEKSGVVAEGTGAAIGGPGVEKYKIEETAVKNNVPLHAIVVKMSQKEALTAIKDELKKAVDEVMKRIERVIDEKTKEGDSIIIAGIGNTLGVA